MNEPRSIVWDGTGATWDRIADAIAEPEDTPGGQSWGIARIGPLLSITHDVKHNGVFHTELFEALPGHRVVFLNPGAVVLPPGVEIQPRSVDIVWDDEPGTLRRIAEALGAVIGDGPNPGAVITVHDYSAERDLMIWHPMVDNTVCVPPGWIVRIYPDDPGEFSLWPPSAPR